MKRPAKRHTYDDTLLVTVLILVLVGLILLTSTSAYNGRVKFHDSYYYLKKQGLATVLGMAGMLWIAGIDYHRWIPLAVPGYLAAIGLSIAVMAFGKEYNGSKRWLSLGPFSFQPSEFGKIALVLYLAAALSSYEAKNNFKGDAKQLWQPALVAGFSMGCMVLQRDLGSALIFFGISITLLYVATSKRKYVFTALGLAAIGSVAGYAMFGHVRERVKIWLDPWKYALGSSYQIVEGMYSIAAGGLFGVGLGQGHFENLPVKESDMIYAIICEEFGIIFAIGLMIIYFLLFYRGIRAAFVTKDSYSQLIAVGFSTMIACQTLVIIGGIFAVIPLTGITLPIISYGGSSVLTIFFALGILQKISEEA